MPNKYRARVDKNQGAVITELSDLGCAVFPMHSVGGGFPDLLWFYRNVYGLIEVKDETGFGGKNRNLDRCLTPAQKKFHADWPGPIDIVWTPQEAVEAVLARVST